MTGMWQDLRYSTRILCKSPGFTLIAILSVGLGIGANATLFSVVNAVLLRPLPGVHQPGELAYFALSSSFPAFRHYEEHNSVFSGLFAFDGTTLHLGIAGEPEPIRAHIVSPDYFSVLGIKPILGRFFERDEHPVSVPNPVAVISYRFWQRRFDGAPGAVGRTIRFNGIEFRIIGVAPRCK